MDDAASAETIAWLDRSAAEPDEIGGKGAGLVALHRGGFPVPPGFVITAEAYRRFVRANDLQPLIDSVLDTPNLRVPRVAREAATHLSPALAEATIPAGLHAAIAAAYDQLRQRGGSVVAVRSSALSEDGASASSAGLYETYLNIRDLPAVLDAVRRCYASLWSVRAIQYRAFRNLGGRDEAMAVVVMAQIRSDASGVVFTANPMTGDRGQIVVNASWGLGEAIVSGRVTPDHFVFDKQTLVVLSRDLAGKAVEVVPDPDGASGTIVRTVEQRRMDAPALSDPQLATLGGICREIEIRYGHPVDVEWACAGGAFFVLQARPITGLA